jgi:uncharacterized protein
MVIKEMTGRECRAMFSGSTVARLGCALNNQPYIVPTRLYLQDECLYGYATLGLKIEWMRQNPLVCVGVDHVESQTQWVSVVVLGEYEELPDIPENAEARRTADRLFQGQPLWWKPGSVPVTGQQQRPWIVFRILITRMTGRRAGPEPSESS